MSGWLQLTVRERELLKALVEDGIEVQGALQEQMLADKDPRQFESDVEHFIDVILDTEEPKMVLEGLLEKLDTSLGGGGNGGHD